MVESTLTQTRRCTAGARQALNCYEFQGRSAQIVPIGAGLINETFKFSADGGESYVLQRINDRVFPQPLRVMENLIRITGHLREKGVPSLELVNSVHGIPWVSGDDGGVWRCTRYVADGITYQSSGLDSILHNAGAAFGQFSAALADLPVPPLNAVIPGFHDTPKRLKNLQLAVATDAHDRVRQVQAEIDDLYARQSLANRFVIPERSGEVPQRVAHNDTKLNNVLFHRRDSRALCVIDLDTTMPGLSLHDFGDLVRSAAARVGGDGSVCLELGRYVALAGGYLRAMRDLLGAAELHYLADAPLVVTYELALRFLTDYLDGDRYFRTDRPGQNLERCRRQIALLGDMESRYDGLRRKMDALVTSMEPTRK